MEKNVLGPGVIGHILRNRSTNSTTFATVDSWFHYDQAGSVMAESNSGGTLGSRHDQDAFGIKQTSWSAGTPSPSTAAGWHHNTKNTDADTGLVYMYQRWYLPETGTFLSKAPMPIQIEHSFSFGKQIPTLRVDPHGMVDIQACAMGRDRCIANYADTPGPVENILDCILWCELAFICCIGDKVQGATGDDCNWDFEYLNPWEATNASPYFDCGCDLGGGKGPLLSDSGDCKECCNCAKVVAAQTGNRDPDKCRRGCY